MYPGPLPLGSGVRVVGGGGHWRQLDRLLGRHVPVASSREGRRDILSLGTSVAQAKPPLPARNAPSPAWAPASTGPGLVQGQDGRDSKARFASLNASPASHRGASQISRGDSPLHRRRIDGVGVLPARASSPPSKPTKSVPYPSRARCSSPVPPTLRAEHDAARGWSVQSMAQCDRSASSVCGSSSSHMHRH